MARLLWTQRQDTGPSPRIGHAMAYDTARKRVVLYGGSCRSRTPLTPSHYPGDTWEWDGGHWLQVADIGPPHPPLGHPQLSVMAYDADRDRGVLLNVVMQWAKPNDSFTYEWDGACWTQVADTGPAVWGSATYDEAKKRVVFVGQGKTWEWDGAEWTQLEDTGPAGRGALAYDSGRKRVVFFGGDHPQPFGTWEWDGALWKKMSGFGPPNLMESAMVYDGDRKRVVLFGGAKWVPDAGGSAFHYTAVGDTWEWDGHLWVQRQDMGPPPRYQHAMAYDPARKRAVMFGGMTSNANPIPGLGNIIESGDTWELADYPVR